MNFNHPLLALVGTQTIRFLLLLSVISYYCPSVLADDSGKLTQTTYANGQLNVANLIRDIEKVPRIPRDKNCDFNKDGEDDKTPKYRTIKERQAYLYKEMLAHREIELKKSKCEEENRKEHEIYNLSYQSFNHIWVPAIKTAIEQGDQVAELIMTVCSTTEALDRTGYASDCSKQESLRKVAQLRLEAINFKPALIKRENYNAMERAAKCPPQASEFDKNMICNTEAAIRRYKAMLDGIKVGNLFLSEYWNTCFMKSNDKKVDSRIEECQRLFLLTRTAPVLSERSYVENLSLTNQRFPDPHNAFNIRKLTRLDWSPFSDPDFQTKFNRDADALASEISKNIDLDLKRDPRFGIFLVDKAGRRQFQ